MLNILLVAIGGATGSVARYLTGHMTLKLFGPSFPWGTLVVNTIGSLAIGIFAELIARRFDASHELRLLIITGFLGGFTTFSAFSLDVAVMVERGAILPALAYVTASMLVSLLAVFAGLALMRALL
ncbi:fluoride efflux transporter CrcB [Rhizobium sp. KVB221]|uniref:Fluoride-specific ion channel FluC n=1 Tax=Rhizobium setariae TaxID=2801340 RepID=A0A936YTI4_9HYPH|nr:fluoride efflux transporter CrcB [Rhizobium setariae]MBL0372736.1 fluoride efflux transporter CrcB [Rhizobium setariae]